MTRVLHLLPHAADFQTRRGVAALVSEPGEGLEASAVTIGRGGDVRDVLGAVRRLRGGTGFDVVHAWGSAALTAAAFAGRGRIVHSPDAEVRRQGLDWLRAVASHRAVEVVLPTATLRRACVGRGVPPDRCHLVRPGVDFGRVKRRRDPGAAGLRRRLGLGEDDFVLLLPGESTRATAFERAVWAAAILSELDPRYRLLAWGRGPRSDGVARFAEHLHKPQLLRRAEQHVGRAVEFDELLSAADAAVVTARSPVATLPVAACMAAGLPIVSTVTYTVAELLEDRHTALMVPSASPRLLARRVLDLREDASLQWSIADMARTEAFEFFSLTRFRNQFRAVYRQVAAGEPVSVPEPQSSAGLRFHGRG